MNRLYIIAPIVLMVIFAFLYMDGKKKIDAEKERIKIEKDAADAQAEADKAAAREKAKKDAEIADAKRLQEEKEKADRKEREFQEGVQRIKDETTTFTAELNKSKAHIAQLEKEISGVRSETEKLNRQSIEMSKSIASALIERQTAELEIQRYAQMVALKAKESVLTRATPAPTTTGR